MRTEARIEKVRRVLERRQLDLTVVLENVHDPHNVSAVLRTCDSVGIYKVYLIYHSGQKFPDLSKRSSASAVKWVKLQFFDNVEECYNLLRGEGFKIYSTALTKEAVSLYSLDLTQKVALVFGNEHTGVSELAVSLADGNFRIPQVGMVESLNISVACAVSLYEAFRQRNSKGMYDKPQITGQMFEEIFQKWLQK
ncbi:MAG: tRNA (guanosine(18)-2'-O)-methyltransferase [Candidatus Kapaibacterium sp.]|nr:MAG: tRNA (guanosine(18)-2'-O)-methyltransferase [Candidatus Kapabacteria bacterium]